MNKELKELTPKDKEEVNGGRSICLPDWRNIILSKKK
jgi:hypothetical protein